MTRIEEEIKTVGYMITLYCRKVHHSDGKLCEQCKELMEYSSQRLRKCPFQEDKNNCNNCKVHCYGPTMREKIRVVMRFSGPRMMLYHPLVAIRHILRNWK